MREEEPTASVSSSDAGLARNADGTCEILKM